MYIRTVPFEYSSGYFRIVQRLFSFTICELKTLRFLQYIVYNRHNTFSTYSATIVFVDIFNKFRLGFCLNFFSNFKCIDHPVWGLNVSLSVPVPFLRQSPKTTRNKRLSRVSSVAVAGHPPKMDP